MIAAQLRRVASREELYAGAREWASLFEPGGPVRSLDDRIAELEAEKWEVTDEAYWRCFAIGEAALPTWLLGFPPREMPLEMGGLFNIIGQPRISW